jgi:hypothetical protein
VGFYFVQLIIVVMQRQQMSQWYQIRSFLGTHNSCQTGCFKDRSFRSKLHRWFVVDKNSVITSGGKVAVHRALAIRLVGALFPTSTHCILLCEVDGSLEDVVDRALLCSVIFCAQKPL